jgi:hypothetical protein
VAVCVSLVEILVAHLLRLRILRGRRIPREHRLRLRKGRFERTGIEGEQELALTNFLPFGEMDCAQLARHLRPDLDSLERFRRAHGRYGQRHGLGGHPRGGHRHRSTGPAAASTTPAASAATLLGWRFGRRFLGRTAGQHQAENADNKDEQLAGMSSHQGRQRAVFLNDRRGRSVYHEP